MYVTARFPFGSGEGFLIPELQELLRRGHEIRIVPIHDSGALIHSSSRDMLAITEQQSLISPHVLQVALGELRSAKGTTLKAATNILNFGRLAIRLRNALVYPKALFVARIAREWKASHIHAYWGAAPATAAMIASDLSGLRWSFTGHRWDIATDNLLAQKLSSASAARVISESSLALAHETLAEHLPRTEVSRLLSRTHVIHLGVNLPLQASPASRTPRVLCSASLLPIKGHAFLLAAFARVLAICPTAELLLAGDGHLRASLVAQAHSLGISRHVRFLGVIPREELLAMYSSGSIMCAVLASITLGVGQHEGIPVSLMEAMAHGVPVVATSTGGIPELVRSGTGMLVPPCNIEALAEALSTVLTTPALRDSLRHAGRERIRESFDVGTCVGSLLNLLSQ